jgi:hypothetical protein
VSPWATTAYESEYESEEDSVSEDESEEDSVSEDEDYESEKPESEKSKQRKLDRVPRPSQYFGVCWKMAAGKWYATSPLQGFKRGSYTVEEQAARHYDRGAEAARSQCEAQLPPGWRA